jgi:hypothetical protein
MSEYRETVAINQSLLKVVSNENLAAFKYYWDNWDIWTADEPTDSMKLGSAIDCAVLDWPEFERLYRPKRERGEGYLAYNRGLETDGFKLVSKDQHDLAIKSAQLVRNHPLLAPIIEAGEKHKAFYWTENGHPFKAELDCVFIHNGTAYVLDIKSSDSAHPDDFLRKVLKYRYHYQGAFYSDIFFTEQLKSLWNVERVLYYWPVLQTKGVPNLTIYSPSDWMMEAGRREYMNDEVAIFNAFETGQWPAYAAHDEVLTLDLPNWYKQ